MIGLGHSLSLALLSQGLVSVPVAPAVPDSFAVASQTDTTIVMSWHAVPSGIRVHLQWQAAGGDWSSPLGDLTDTPPPPQECSVLAADAAYDFRIRAENEAGNSDWVMLSNVYTRPSSPTGLAAATGSYAAVNLTWDALPAGMTLNLSINNHIAASGLTGGSYTTSGSTPGATYNFAISAVGGVSGLESARCADVSGTAGAGSAPVNLLAPTITDFGSTAGLTDPGTWSGDPAVLSYIYEWQCNGVFTGTGLGCSYGATGTYTCIVTATNAVGSAQATSNFINGNAP